MSLLAGVQDVLFPARCLACETLLGRYRLPLLCSDCVSRLVPLVSPLCLCCGMPFEAGEDHLCGNCLAGKSPFDLIRSAFSYQEPLVTLIHQVKFGRRLTGLATLGVLARNSSAWSSFSRPDLILPVPLHCRRLRQRGFNQSLLLARSCFPGWKDRIAAAGLRRIRDTIPQTDLTGKERRKNLKGAFCLNVSGGVAGKSILLVDDVFTTGSTVVECSRILQKAGAARVEVFTLARAL